MAIFNMVYKKPVEKQRATQGPAPDGFHVPLISEWNAVKNIWTSLGGGSSDGTNFGIALKLPFAGFRDGSSANVYYQGSRGYYTSSSYLKNGYMYPFALSSSAVGTSAGDCTFGYTLRCVKNISVNPKPSRTKLYGTSIDAGGIFWSLGLGLISLSSDGTTWITIQDKNLGATAVWNSGDALSQANCGYYYQWGNNYGFDWTGTLTDISTSQVDARLYGPGNYYYSNIFIKKNGAWDSSNNANLRGGVDGNVPV